MPVQEYTYPTFKEDGFTLWSTVMRMFLPALVCFVGMFVTVAVLVTINDD